MTHPLTDEMLWEMAGTWRESSYCDGCRAAYDKGRAEMLDDVLEWLGKNLSNPKYSDISEEHKIISGQVEQFSYIITDAIQDDLLEAMSPQEES